MPPRAKAAVVDTNVLVRFLVGDDQEQAAASADLFRRVEGGRERIEIIESVVTEVIWTLASFYRVPRNEIADALATLFSVPGVEVKAKAAVISALARYGTGSADFVDCLLAERARRKHVPVVTFDATDFKRLGVPWKRP